MHRLPRESTELALDEIKKTLLKKLFVLRLERVLSGAVAVVYVGIEPA